MTTLGCKRPVFPAVPEETYFTKSRARRDDGSISLCVMSALIEDLKVFGLKYSNPIRVGLQVIDQTNQGEVELQRYLLGIDHPRQIGGLTATIADRPSDPQTGACDGMQSIRQEFAQGTLKTQLFTAREGFFSEKVEVSLHDLYHRQAGIGPADVSGKNRASLFLRPSSTPSRTLRDPR